MLRAKARTRKSSLLWILLRKIKTIDVVLPMLLLSCLCVCVCVSYKGMDAQFVYLTTFYFCNIFLLSQFL